MVNNHKKLTRLNWLLALAFILLVITLTFYFITFNGKISDDNAKWGTFGDFVGGTLNPLFALLSLFAIIYTIKIQTEELELTRNEMQQSNKTLDDQRKTSEKQNQSIKQQTFENTFFNLLEHHNNLVEEIYKVSDDTYYKIIVFHHQLELLESFADRYNRGIFKTYFMTLYQILKFVNMQEEKFINEDFFNAKLYTNIIRATFDDVLLCLLAINCEIEGFEKFKFFIEEYNFFEHLNIYQISNIRNEESQERILTVLMTYDEKAFGENVDLINLISVKKAKS